MGKESYLQIMQNLVNISQNIQPPRDVEILTCFRCDVCITLNFFVIRRRQPNSMCYQRWYNVCLLGTL